MRLDKFLTHSSDLTRREAHYVIRGGGVTIDGVVCKKAAQKISPQSLIEVDGKALSLPEPIYLMLHKPLGVICSNSDADHPIVLDFIPHSETLQIAGRLDLDTSGLVLITDDGIWNHKVTSPNRSTPKRYNVTTAEPISAESIAQFETGILLQNEKKPCKPASITLINQTQALLTISEGKYHQVKRMFGATGNRVVTLHREAIGAIELDSSLAPGQYRALTATEISSI